MPIGNSTHPNKRAHYTAETLPAEIYVAPGKSVITLTTRSDSPNFILLNYDYNNTPHTIMGYNHFYDRAE